jgi:hypothetical protein
MGRERQKAERLLLRDRVRSRQLTQRCGRPIVTVLKRQRSEIRCDRLTGRAPFVGGTLASVVEKTLHVSPPAPSRLREDLPRSLDGIVARAMQKESSQRYQNVASLAQELLNYEQFDYLIDQTQAVTELASALEGGHCV